MPTTTLARPSSSATRSVAAPARPSFVRLTRIELRKATDYRAGRWVLGVMTLLSLLAIGWDLAHAGSQDISFQGFVDDATTPTALLIPVLGVLAMTSEWTQRTALTTFTLSPRRVPVLMAKLVAALVLMLGVLLVVVALSALATAVAGLVTGDPVVWDTTLRYWGGQVVTQGLFVLMGAGFGAVIPITGVALTAFFITPTLLAIASETILKRVGDWFDVFGAFDRIGGFRLDGQGWQTLSAVTVWVLVPLVVGTWLSVRREVK